MAALIASMEALQQRVCADVKPGVDYVALHVLAHRLLADVLREHTLVKCSADEAIQTGITRAFLPHGLGHLLGLQVHDAGGWQRDPSGALREPPSQDPFLRLTRVLQPGFVVTIEPGLYFIPALMRAALAQHEDKLNRSKIERMLADRRHPDRGRRRSHERRPQEPHARGVRGRRRAAEDSRPSALTRKLAAPNRVRSARRCRTAPRTCRR